MKSESKRFQFQKWGAQKRGIPFRLTFEQWRKIWADSGHWDEHGPGRDQYCMARIGDKGGYEIGNVNIITNAENWSDRSEEYRTMMRDNLNRWRQSNA